MGTSAWAYDVPDGWTIKNVFIGTQSGTTVNAEDYESAESTTGWTSSQTLSIASKTQVSVDLDASAYDGANYTVPTYVGGNTIRVAGTGSVSMIYSFDAVSTGKLIFEGDFWGGKSDGGSENTSDPVYFRFLDSDGNTVLQVGPTQGSGNQYFQIGGTNMYIYGTESVIQSYNRDRYLGYGIRDMVIDFATGEVSLTLDYVNESNVRKQVSVGQKASGYYNMGLKKNIAKLQVLKNDRSKASLKAWLDNVKLYNIVQEGKHSYNIYARSGATNLKLLGAGELAEDGTYSVTNLSKVLQYGGKYYVLDDNTVTKFATQTYTMGTSDETKYINYTLDESILYFEEGESITYGGDLTYSSDFSGGICINYRATKYKGSFTVEETGRYSVEMNIGDGHGTNSRHFAILTKSGDTYTPIASTDVSGTTPSVKQVYTKYFSAEAGTTLYTGYTANTLGLDYLIIRKIGETVTFNALKTKAEALVAVANDNASANSTLSTAISTQAAAVESATTASAITTATNTLKTAMLTYIGAANPTGANEFDLEFMIVNPGMEVDGAPDGYQNAVTGWSRCATVTNYRPIAITSFTNTSGAFTGTYAYENWHGAGLAGQMKQTISDMPDGVYKVQLGVFVGSLNGQFAYAKSNGVTYKYPLTVGNETEDATIYVPVTGGSLEIGLDMNDAGVAWAAIDNARIHKVNYNVSKTITSAGWATYCSPYALDLEHATGLTDAFIVTGGTGGVLAKTSVKGGTVPANTGLLLKGDEGTATIPVVASSSTSVSGNKLVGVTTETVLDLDSNDDGTADQSVYVLMNDATNGLGFYQTTTTSFTLGANTAYLPSNFAGAGARFFSLFDDEATSIKNLTPALSEGEGVVYNLRGQRVTQPTKGLYIVNGKKFIIK